MKNELAIVAGLLMILAASFIAAGTSSQDTTPRPQLAQALATTFHVTPSATPRPTLTPIPTVTPLRVSEPVPSDQEILEFLFQYPYWGAYIIPSPSKLSVQQLVLDTPTPTLIIAGNGATATNGYESYHAAFGAVSLGAAKGMRESFCASKLDGGMPRFRFQSRQTEESSSASERLVTARVRGV